jgi:GTP pyrophosphokinase
MAQHHESLIAALVQSVPPAFHKRIQKAVFYAQTYYAKEPRMSGEDLFSHTLRSAIEYSQLRIDVNGVIATLLHHRLPAAVYDDAEVFSEDVVFLLDTLEEVFSKVKEEGSDTVTLSKYILSFADDMRIALIKLSEKVDSARTIGSLDVSKREKAALRLLSIYAPLAEYLNLTDAKVTFENEGFRVLHPVEQAQIVDFVKAQSDDIESLKNKIGATLSEITEIVSVTASVWGRIKSPYSIWKKQQKYIKEGKENSLTSLNDILAFTLMVDSVDQCYAVAYALMSYAEVLDKQFEDYIQQPKPNGFKQIQLVCTLPDFSGQKIEVQILTKEMYWHNTYGPASHFAYKMSGARFAKSTSEYEWIERVHDVVKDSQASMTIPESMPIRANLFKESIYVFSPKHRIVELPIGGTAIDFAYHIHTEVGNKAVRAAVNDKIVTLDTVLQSGDVVSVITDKSKQFPSVEWSKFAVTKNAQVHIKRGLIAKKKKGI